ncbi:RNA polymerase sigma-70 factor [Flavivirga spongiicola]|uniref:RNA polymerase sigma-70 factor n=1 Tax=Flavivirga spongiicola TaxID=421621 RepID=A0ABU7XVN4_9FLAO|nr:RNA polymerase sigma-70 factor [Flavivirga sp. MEBiC05379]MDO5979836.1 RNA polymerase sigma-70 factor [Flavivirga sp. MEBiC05379]
MILRSYSDKELLEQIALGNSKAFKELHEMYASKMFLYAFNVIKNKEACEDIIQNIFIDFWSKRKEAKIINIKAYLFRAVKYQIFNYFRDQKFTKEDITRLNIVDLSVNTSKKMEYDELKKAIHDSVNKLPKRCKEIFELSRYQYKSNKEISEDLKISMQAVKNQISKALKFIKKDLQDEEHLFYFICISSNQDHFI